MLKLKLQYFGHLMPRVDSLEKTLMLGRIGGRRRRERQRTMARWHQWPDGREFEWTLAVGDGQGGLACCDSWGHKESDMTERLNWTDTNPYLISHSPYLPLTIRFHHPAILWNYPEKPSHPPKRTSALTLLTLRIPLSLVFPSASECNRHVAPHGMWCAHPLSWECEW